MHPAERAKATDRVLGMFRELPFSWENANCIQLAREQAIALGHDVPAIPKFKTPRGAKKALASQGADSVSGLLDLYFERWPAPAFARMGDLVTVPGASEHELEAVGIVDGQGNAFMWHEATDFRRLEVVKLAEADFLAAWRV